METKPKRSFALRFSLRALIVTVTLVCCWLGWETSVIRERRRLREEAAREGVFRFQTEPVATLGFGPQPPTARVSFVRRLLGDEPVQNVWYWSHSGASPEKIARLKRAFPEAAFNEYLPEPCHPGCFPAGTPVETPTGPRAIETVAAGDEVLIVLSDGTSATANVRSVFVTQNILWRVDTANESLVTTETQPLCLADGATRAAGELKPGDRLRQWKAGVVGEIETRGVASLGRRAKVFNLILGDQEHFVANGFVARSKPPVESTRAASTAGRPSAVE